MSKGKSYKPSFANSMKPKMSNFMKDKMELSESTDEHLTSHKDNARSAVSEAKSSMKNMNRIKTG